MPAPKLLKAVMDEFDPRRQSVGRAVLGKAARVMFGKEASSEFRRAAEARAWVLSAPEGMPPYPQRGDTYSKAEAAWLIDWLQDIWAPYRQFQAEAQHTAAWITQHVGVGAWKRGVGGVLLGFGSAGSDIPGAFFSYAHKQYPYAGTAVYLGSPDGVKSTTLDPAGLTPQQWVERVWAYAIRELGRYTLELRAMRQPILYQEQHTPQGIDDQMRAYGAIGVDAQWRAMSHFYRVREHDRLPDPRFPGEQPDQARYLRYERRGRPPLPFSQILAIAQRKNDDYERQRAATDQRRADGLTRLLQGLARAPVDLVWNASQFKKYAPSGFEIEQRYASEKPYELAVSTTGPDPLRVLFLSASPSAGRAGAWSAVGDLVTLFRTDPHAAVKSVWSRHF